jgi:cytochrome c oxidase cbb3-type subunit II
MDKPDVDVFRTIYSGIPANGMPAYGDQLGKDRTWKLVTYLKSMHRL